MHIGIIGGSGRLGLWYARLFARVGHEVTITGRNREKLDAAARRAHVQASADNARVMREADIVLVSAPLEATPELVRESLERAKPGALVADLASVKGSVCEVYAATERRDVELASLHPLHGPRLTSLDGISVLYVDLRTGARFEELRRILISEGAAVLPVGPEEHDRHMALLQGLTHFIAIAAGRTLADSVLPTFETPAHGLLRTAIARVVLQDPSLYAAIQLENPHNDRLRRSFLDTAARLGEMAERRDFGALEREIEACARALGDKEAELADTDACVDALAARRPAAVDCKVAVLGPPGTFSELALAQHSRRCGQRFKGVFLATIADVFESVKKGNTELGIVPVENMIDGSIAVTLDKLFETGLQICAELLVPVHQSLSALPGTELSAVTRVLSIGPALAQVKRWLAANLPGAKLVETNSTAEAIDRVARQRFEGDAAIGLDSTAEAAGLAVLARDIEDEKENVTRFVVVRRADASRTGRDRTTLCAHEVPNRAGTLERILQIFARHGINLSKIESRPTRKRLGAYQFYIDVEGHRDDEPLRAALAELSVDCRITLLGSYPRAF